MTFKNLKKPIVTVLESLTVAQQNKLCDYYEDGTLVDKGFKHSMSDMFQSGEKYGHLIAPQITKMQLIEAEAQRIVSEGETVIGRLRSQLIQLFPDFQASFIQHVVSAIVAATGTWAEYVEAVGELNEQIDTK